MPSGACQADLYSIFNYNYGLLVGYQRGVPFTIVLTRSPSATPSLPSVSISFNAELWVPRF